MELFAEYWSTDCVNIWKTTINCTGTDGEQHCADQPLSWKLDKDQRRCFDKTWGEAVSDPKENQAPALHCVALYLRGKSPPAPCKPAAVGEDLATKRLLVVAYFLSGILLFISVAFGRIIGYSLIDLATAVFSFLLVIQAIAFLGPYLAIPGIKQTFVDNFREEGKKAGEASWSQ